MTRNVQRARPPRADPRVRRAADGAATTVVEPVADGWQHTLDLTRAVLAASLGGSREWMQGLCDWQGAQTAWMQHTVEQLGEAARQAEQAPDWPSLMALQARFAGTQWTSAMQDIGTLAERGAHIESRWVERSQADATRLGEPWIGNRWLPVANAATVEPVAAPAATDMYGQAQAAMNEVSRLWTQALYDTSFPD